MEVESSNLSGSTNADVAQQVEQPFRKRKVGGSIPPIGTKASVVELVYTADLSPAVLAAREFESLRRHQTN